MTVMLPVAASLSGNMCERGEQRWVHGGCMGREEECLHREEGTSDNLTSLYTRSCFS